MARIFQTGFEHQSLEVFNQNQNGSIDTGTVRNGAASHLASNVHGPSGTFAYYGGPSTLDECYFRAAIRATSWASSTTDVFLLGDAAFPTPTQIGVYVTDGVVGVRRGGLSGPFGKGTLLDSAGTLSVDTWHLIEAHFVIANSGGVAQVKLDGTMIIDFTGDTQDSTNAYADRFIINGGNNLGHYMDDVAINDTANGPNGETHNKSWIGEGKCIKMAPNAAGANTDLSRGGTDSGANWSQVEEVGPNDADYVFSDVADEFDLYNLDDVTDADSVNAIIIWTRAQKDDAGARSFARMLRSESTNDQGADTAVSEAFQYYPEILEQDPVDSSLWTEAKLDALQAGVKVR